ncbi:MAG: WbqC family protein [Candidatus Methanoperedens sp.]|nr:WbqC family protein [Candidatus Methanoperedens sp.]
MDKIVTIHQPNYLPWLGFFSKIKQANCFVILDIVKYSKNSVINRNKIRTKEGGCYLTIPINKEYYSSRICDVILPKENNWQRNHWKTIEANYNNSDYFDSYKDFFKLIYAKEYDYLWQVNENIINYLLNCFGIEIEVVKASELDIDSNLHASDLLVSILKHVNASTYLSGPSGLNYLESTKFKNNNINLNYFNFHHPIYKQRYNGFEPNLAGIDLLFNLGEKSKELI